MNLLLEKEKPWNKMEILYQANKFYNHFDNSDIEIFIYGYPYHAVNVAWLSAQDLYQIYLEKKGGFVSDIEGAYAIIVLDKINRKCLIITDRYKIYTFIYIMKDENSFIISDSIKEIIKYIPQFKLNKESLLEFFNFGFILGNKTPIEEIYTFEPATIYTIDENLNMQENIYWQFQKEKNSKATKEEFLNLFNKHVLNGLSLEDKISMPLTGGLDSRTVLSACISKKGQLHCYTHGIKQAEDVKIAKGICQMLKIDYNFYETDAKIVENIPLVADKLTDEFNGMLNVIMFSHLISSYEQEKEKGFLFFSGVGGELLRCYFTPKKLIKSTSLEDCGRGLRKKIQLRVVSNIYKNLREEDINKLLDSSVIQQLQSSKKVDAISLGEFFYLTNRIANFAAPGLRFVGKYFKLFNPFLERNILQLISFIDAQEKINGEVQRYIITKNSSNLATILLNSGKAIDSENKILLIKSKLKSLFLFFKKRTNYLTKVNIFKINYTDYNSWLRKHHRQYVLKVLDYNKMYLKELFIKEKFNEMVTDFLSGRKNISYFLTNIMTIEIWLKKLYEEVRQEH
jgi:asparagine synthase (glutamine-hydrolysing)